MRIRGIIPALYTAFDGRGEFDPERQSGLIERLIAEGVQGLFAGGTTGEFPLLSLEERESLISTSVLAARGRVPVIAHVGSAATGDSARLARHAVSAGAAAVSCIPPYYYRLREEEILDHFRAVAEASLPLPFYGYHIPEMTRVPMTDRLRDGLLSIGNFAGLKWSDPDLFGLAETVAAFGEQADVLSGKDEVLLAALAMGARGAVGSTYNFLAPRFVALWEAFHRGDLEGARRHQERAGKILSILFRWDGGFTSGKEATRCAGSDCGEPRAPLRRYSPDEKRRLQEDLDRVGFLR